MSLKFVARGIYIVVTGAEGTTASINTNNITLIRDRPDGGSLIEFVGGGSFCVIEPRTKITSMISGAINDA